jgi:hypothetical protein
MAIQTKNRKMVALVASILALGMAVFYYFYAQDATSWEKWVPVGLFGLVAVVAFVRYRSL